VEKNARIFDWDGGGGAEQTANSVLTRTEPSLVVGGGGDGAEANEGGSGPDVDAPAVSGRSAAGIATTIGLSAGTKVLAGVAASETAGAVVESLSVPKLDDADARRGDSSLATVPKDLVVSGDGATGGGGLQQDGRKKKAQKGLSISQTIYVGFEWEEHPFRYFLLKVEPIVHGRWQKRVSNNCGK